eukprot:9174631-Pyramimonas_sp.AAC.1
MFARAPSKTAGARARLHVRRRSRGCSFAGRIWKQDLLMLSIAVNAECQPGRDCLDRENYAEGEIAYVSEKQPR